MVEFRRVTKRDDPAAIAKLAARYESLLLDMIETTIRMTETDSWPKRRPSASPRARRKKA